LSPGEKYGEAQHTDETLLTATECPERLSPSTAFRPAIVSQPAG
jgi:hypothetical protein